MAAYVIAVISDIHDAEACPIPKRRGEFGLLLLRRAVQRLNRWVKPDAVAVLGDLVDHPEGADTPQRLAAIKEALDQLEAPVIVIPGNHDPEPDRFYQVFPRPPEWMDVGSLRLVPFVDPPEPGFNARRLPHDLERMAAARAGHAGPIVALHHVPLLPPGATRCPYGYTNAEEVLAAAEAARITLSIGGHHHAGTELVRRDQSAYLCVKALCEAPFTFTLVRIGDDGRIEVSHEALSLPAELGLIDLHTHSQFAYCSRGMDLALTPAVAELVGLAGVAVTEHSGQLYFERRMYWGGAFCERGIETEEGVDARIGAYWQQAEAVRAPAVWIGLEIDADYAGRLVVRPEDYGRAEVRIGAVHYLRSLRAKEKADPERVADDFLAVTAQLVRSGIDVLAHPFRVFRRAGLEVPERLFAPVVRLLRENGVAAEVNFHTNTPDPRFFRACLDAGVKLTFGSDAHEPHAIGEFTPHVEFLSACGYDGDVRDVLWTPPADRRAAQGAARIG